MRKSVALLFIIAAGALALAISQTGAMPGALDPTWGEEGLASVMFTENGDIMTAGHLTDDGQAVAVGWVNGYPGEFGVARLKRDGTLDPSFGQGGKVMTRFSDDPNLPNSAWAVGLRLDGGYLVAGEICDVDYVVCEWVSAAYTHDGALDDTFGGGDGWITSTVPGAAGVYSWPPRNLLQPDGKVIIGGIVVQPDDDIDLALRRHNLDGSLDVSFDGDGIAVFDFGGVGNYVENISLLPGGKILVVGGNGEVIDPFTYTVDEGFLFQLNEDGTPDNTFSDDGVVTWDEGSLAAGPEDLVVASSGDIYVAGVLQDPETELRDCGVWRFDGDGVMDMTFGDEGLLIIDSGQDDYCLSIALLPDGKPALTGEIHPPAEEMRTAGSRRLDRGVSYLHSVQVGETRDALVARATTGGELDETFGDGGWLAYDIGLADNGGYIVLAQPDGKMLVFGDMLDTTTETQVFAVTRFLGDGPAAQVFVPVVRK